MSDNSKKLNDVAKNPAVRLPHPNITYVDSLLYYCYERMRECISQVEQLMVKVEDLQKVEEDAPSQTKLSDF
jgi:hypothetical protein